MGKHFGELATIRGIVYYKLSPHEMKPFAGVFTYGIVNVLVRTSASILYWLPPLASGYFIYTGVEAAYHHSKRKDPRDFMDEVDPGAE